MDFKKIFSGKNELHIFASIVIALVIPSFFINLGITPLIEDEATRGLVTLEMNISGDYIVPTIGGSYYYNKPPMFNWIVLPFFRAGGYNELMLRLPTVISLLLFSLTIFLFVRKHVSNRVAFIAALMFLTCGRIIVYESLKGLIDIVFSWVLFTNFMVLYNGIKNRRYVGTFLISYLLLTIAFMLKGLPALIFQAITVLVLLFFWDRWKMFKIVFSWRHILGLLLFLILIGSYYWEYFQRNPDSTGEMISIIFQQSARRTAIRFGFGAMITHFISYPFEFAMHFLPWTLLFVYLFKKRSKELLTNKFISCCLWVFITNILIYWTSPESFPRYVLMLVPMVYVILIYLADDLWDGKWIPGRIINYFFLFCFFAALITVSFIPFLSETSATHYLWAKTSFLFVSIGIIFTVAWLQSRNILILTAIFLLVFRIGFNWFVLPYRLNHLREAEIRSEASKIGNFARSNDVYVYGKPFVNFNEDVSVKYVNFFTRFYISAQAQKMIRDSKDLKPNRYYLVHPKDIEGRPHEALPGLEITTNKDTLFVVQFK